MATSEELVAETRAKFPSAQPSDKLPSLEVIGRVTQAQRDYIVTLLGEEPYNAHTDYHLALRPVRQPKKFRLRELWIDERDYAIDKLVTDGEFLEGPGPGARWSVTFLERGGVRYIETESAQGELRYGGARRRSYRDVSVAFEDIVAAGLSRIFTRAFHARDRLVEPPP